jgi:hypothetical protein
MTGVPSKQSQSLAPQMRASLPQPSEPSGHMDLTTNPQLAQLLETAPLATDGAHTAVMDCVPLTTVPTKQPSTALHVVCA